MTSSRGAAAVDRVLRIADIVASTTAGLVVVDGEALTNGSQFRGIGTYLRHVVTGLAARPDVDVALLLPGDGDAPPQVPVVRTSKRVLPPRWRAREHEWRLPAEVRASGGALLHSPAQSAPRHPPVPWVQTLHDLTPLVFRHRLYESERRRWLRLGPRLRSADAVICVSESSARQGVELLGLDAARMHVVPLGVDAVFTPDGPREQAPTPYLLWVAAWGPHKGLAEALMVLEQVRAAGHPHRLVVAGRQDPWMLEQVRATVRASPAAAAVDIAGYVDDLPALYRGATALLMTSRAEGFGLPVLEAMACGLPVVTFANTSLPEVVGDAGLLVADGDTDAMSREILTLLRDDELAADLGRRGPARAAGFTWERTVCRHAEIFRALLDRS